LSILKTFSTWFEPLRAQLPSDFSKEDADALQAAVTQEALRRLDAFMAGLRVYQSYPAARVEDPGVRVLWQEGTTRLLDYAPGSNAPVLLVIPSLVNRFEILDVEPERSFVRSFIAKGFRPLVVDWQAPGEEEQSFTLTDYMMRRLVPILQFVNQSAGPCHVLGYCMGGVLALALALLRQSQVKSLSLMATPWDFAAEGVGGVPSVRTPMGLFFAQQAEKMMPFIEQIGYVPADFLQTMFVSFQPLQILQKFMGFATRAAEGKDQSRFVLTEDWLNNGVPLALPVARECLVDWYKDNALATLSWRVADQTVDPRLLDVPTYILVAGKDRIVPPASALPLSQLIRGATLHEPSMGHIGLMTGNAAPQEVWEPLATWLSAQEAAAA